MTAVGSMPAVRYEVDGHLARIILNRPDKMNAINAEMRQGLMDAFTDVRDNDDVWLAILTGEGKAFCSGQALDDPRTLPPGEPPDLGSTVEARYGPLLTKLLTLEKPVLIRLTPLNERGPF